LSRIHIKKCRLENLTRWSSSFMMLVSFKKAYDKKAFETNNCPVGMAFIEGYIQVLRPAYDFSLYMQRNTTSIANVNILLTLMFDEWESMVLNG
jgi:hypothetical protein